jgi:hypothetical protein
MARVWPQSYLIGHRTHHRQPLHPKLPELSVGFRQLEMWLKSRFLFDQCLR